MRAAGLLDVSDEDSSEDAKGLLGAPRLSGWVFGVPAPWGRGRALYIWIPRDVIVGGFEWRVVARRGFIPFGRL